MSGFTEFAGKLPIPLSSEQVEAMFFSDRAPGSTSLAVADLPVIEFPIRIRICGEEASGRTGEIGGITFESGVSIRWLDYKHVNRFAAAGFFVEDVATGIVISPLSEGTTYLAEGKLWNQFRPLPDRCLEMPDNQESKNGLQTDEEEQGRQEVLVQIGDASGEQSAQSVSEAILRLRPGHKEDFDADGMPLAKRLTALVGFDVSQKLLASAWERVSLRLDADKNAFALPAGDGLKDILESIVRTKGARYLRQYAESRGISNPGRSGGEIIDALIAIGMNVEDARGLL